MAAGFLVAVLAAVAAILATLPYEKELVHTPLVRNTSLTPDARPLSPGAGSGLPYSRTTLHFNSSGTASPHPVVVMAHGLGAQKDLGLHRYADPFARAGMAVLVFDYRTFGGSDGEPRHWVSPRRHVEDWRAALAFVKVPHLDGMENAKANLRTRGLPAVLRLLAAAAHDKLRAAAATGLDRLEAALAPPATASTAPVTKAKAAASDSPAAAVERLLAALRPAAAEAVSWLRAAAAPLLTPAYVKLLGAPGELALMQLQPAEIAAYFSKHPKEYQGGWRPLVLARVALETSSYRPITSLERLAGVPLLFVSAAQDSLCPAAAVRAAAAAAPGGGAEYLELPCDHFSAYGGEHLKAASERMTAFLRRHFGMQEGQGSEQGRGKGSGVEVQPEQAVGRSGEEEEQAASGGAEVDAGDAGGLAGGGTSPAVDAA
eukprot:XP_001696899.1 predicted protein [Chlamydomonas reinhardtii]